MLSKKFLTSIILTLFLINLSLQLSLSEAVKDKLRKKIEDLTMSEKTKENIKKKLVEVMEIFREEVSCRDPGWCIGFKKDECETPITNKTACCLYCAHNITDVDVKELTTKKSPVESNVTSNHRNVEPVVKKVPIEIDEPVVKKPISHKKTSKTSTAVDIEISEKTTSNPDKITLPTEYDAEAEDSTSETSEIVETTTLKPTKKFQKEKVPVDVPETTTLKPVKKLHKEIMLDIDDSDPNEIVLYKKSFEIIPKNCPKEVGFGGCTIVEKCHTDSDCTKSERCCMKNCVRSCIPIQI